MADDGLPQLESVVENLKKLFIDPQHDADLVVLMYDCMNQVGEMLKYNDLTCHTLVLKGIYNKYRSDVLQLNLYSSQYSDKVIFNQSSIGDMIKSTVMHHQDNYFHEVVHDLQTIQQKYRHDHDYGIIIINLINLVTVFADILQESQAHLIEFLNNIFNNELRQLSNLQLHLEQSDLFLNDTMAQEIVTYLETTLAHQLPPVPTKRQSFQGFQNKSGFESNDVNFKNLFYLFLQISGYKFDPSPINYDFSTTIKLMLAVYKQKCHINWLEINDFTILESKIEVLDEFFLNQPTIDPIKQNQIKEVCFNLVNKFSFFPETVDNVAPSIKPETKVEAPDLKSDVQPIFKTEINSEVEADVKPRPITSQNKYHHIRSPSQKLDHPNSFILSASDTSELIKNIQSIVPQLSGFTFDFDPIFHKTLEYYIQLLNDSEDNDLMVADDLNYLNDIILLVNQLVDYENDESGADGDEIYQTAFNLYQLHQLLAIDYIGENNHATILMRFCVCKFKKQMQTTKTLIKKWNLEILTISQLNHNLETVWKYHASNLLQNTIFKIWSNSHKRIEKLSYAAGNYYDKKIQAKFLISKLLPKVQSVKELTSRQQKFILKKQYNKWSSKYQKIKEDECRGVELHKKYVKASMVNVLKSKNSYLSQLSLQADVFNDDRIKNINNIILRFFFNEWYQTIQDFGLLNKLRKLSLEEEKYQLSKFFKTLKLKHDYSRRFNEVIKINQRSLVSYFFQKWRHLNELKSLAISFELQRHNQMKANLFINWNQSTELSKRADGFQRTKIMPRYFKCWKLNLNLKRKALTLESIDKNVLINSQLETFFKKWKLNYKSKNLNKIFDNKLSLFIIQKWISKYDKIQELKVMSLEVSNNNSKKICFELWYTNLQFQNQLPEVSDSFFNKKFFNKLTEKSIRYKEELKLLESRFLMDHPIRSNFSLNDQVSMQSIIRLWKDKRDQKFLDSAEWKITVFKEKIAKPNIERKFLIDWVEKYNAVKRIELDLNVKCDEFLINSGTKRFFLNKWINKLSRAADMNTRSFEFEYRLLHKKYMVIWYDKYLNKSEHLNEICQEYIDQKELRKQSEILSDWSMKFIKVITRHQHSCDLFLNRWESSRSKSIFDLWVYKLRQKQKDESAQDMDITDAKSNVFFDTSMDSIFNESPLATRKKSKFEGPSQTEQQSPGEYDSYLNSPIKQSANKSIFLPDTPQINQSNISPTRVQTSIRLKNERLKALKDHYGRAKDSIIRRPPLNKPSVRPYSFINSTGSILNSNTSPNASVNHRLNPPERPNFSSTPIKEISTSKSPMPISINTTEVNSREKVINRSLSVSPSPPPPPPLHRSRSHFTPLSPQTTLSHTSTTQNDIETAKRLRKITPIIIPEADDNAEPKMSPVYTIKQRNSLTN